MSDYKVGDWRERTVNIYRAGAIGEQHVPTLTIIARAEMPEFNSLDEARALYVDEGTKIADALLQHLAGGVVDQILLRLLTARASLLRIAQGLEAA